MTRADAMFWGWYLFSAASFVVIVALGFLAVSRKDWPQAIFWLLCMNTVTATRTWQGPNE
jgi:hypothetical protein